MDATGKKMPPHLFGRPRQNSVRNGTCFWHEGRCGAWKRVLIAVAWFQLVAGARAAFSTWSARVEVTSVGAT